MASVEPNATTTAYKVVSVVDGKRMSALYGSISDPVEYKPNEWTESPYGGLLVFASLNDAKNFIEDPCFKYFRIHFEIWEVIVHEPVQLRYRGLTYRTNDFRSFWEEQVPSSPDYSSWPPGTMAFKCIKLEKFVHSNVQHSGTFLYYTNAD